MVAQACVMERVTSTSESLARGALPKPWLATVSVERLPGCPAGPDVPSRLL